MIWGIIKDMSVKKIITRDDIRYLADLAKIPLPDEYLPKYQKEIGTIFKLINKLQEVDTNSTEPTSQVTGLINIFREDIVIVSLTQEEALKNAKRTHDGFFEVDAVLED